MNVEEKEGDFVDFFTDYKTFYNQLVIDDQNIYKGLFQVFQDITESGLKEEETLTTTYNIFNILKVETKEDETHTPFLKDLLNIRGSHQQQSLFYDNLLKQIIPDDCERKKFLPNNPLFYSITSQKGIYTDFGQGFIDILIDYVEPGRKSFSILIENKIYHSDGDNQIDKYYSYLETLFQNKVRDNILLIYLTLTGKPPDSHSMKPEMVEKLVKEGRLKLVSYQKDIKSVLTESLNIEKSEHNKSEKVKYTILQYLSLIDKILKTSNMEQYKERLCEFLTNSVENFNNSRQIVDLYQSGEFKEFIKNMYLRNLLVKIESQINQSTEGWKSKIKDYPEYDEIDLIVFKEDWNGLSISWSVYDNVIGICQHDCDFEKLWRTEINEYLRNTNNKENMKEDSPRWLWWENFTFNFNDYNFWLKMIPSNSELTSNDISNQLIRYSSMFQNQVNEVLSLKKV